ncbi:hypothetical protein Tco_0912883 [Tanacetum coccineum]
MLIESALVLWATKSVACGQLRLQVMLEQNLCWGCADCKQDDEKCVYRDRPGGICLPLASWATEVVMRSVGLSVEIEDILRSAVLHLTKAGEIPDDSIFYNDGWCLKDCMKKNLEDDSYAW